MRRLFIVGFVCAAIAGCGTPDDGVGLDVGTADARAFSLFDPVAATASLCGGPAIPFPNNALFADSASPTGITTDTTLNIPSTASTAVAANLTDGFSTVGSAFTDFLGPIDYASAISAVVIIEADASPRILVHGVDYQIQPYLAMAQVSGTGGACPANQGAATFLPVPQQFRSRILIEPLKPLNPSTTYIVGVTKSLLSSDGVEVTPSAFFGIVNSSTRLCRLASDSTDPASPNYVPVACADSDAPATLAATVAPVLANLGAPPTTPAQKLATLETLRRNLVRPTVLGFEGLYDALTGTAPPLTDDDLIIAWSFTTQTVGATLQTLNAIATAKTFTVVDSGLSTADLGIPGTDAGIWVGTFNAVPYYLNDAAAANDVPSQLDYWHNDGTVTPGGVWPAVVFDHDANPATPSIPAPCTGAPFNFVAPVSTTNCYRIPAVQSTENLPVIITVPPGAKPVGGWPVVIFQHGITGHRGQMLPIGATLAGAGFVTVAIDLPLHGIAAGDPTFGALRQAGNERTFDLDISSNASGACLSAPAGDGTADASGTCFINLGSLATTRDNLRQAVADLIHLSKSMGDAGLSFDGGAGNDIDLTAGIRFAGISLGSIVGTTLLGVDTGAVATADETDERISAASLSVPGGGLARLLDASASFGPRIAAGLAGGALSPAPNGVSGAGSPYEGTDTYETFVRFAQHLTDPGDPINYAAAANANHPIHLSEVIGDTVVPNSAMTTCPAFDALPDMAALRADTHVATSNATNAETRLAACRAGSLLVGADAATGMTTLCAGATTLTNSDPIAPACQGSATQDETLTTGFLSGTAPLFGAGGMNIATVAGPINALTGGCANNNNAGNPLDIVVQFALGTATHGSLLSPAGPGGATQFLLTTQEMHRETATYLASNGLTLASGSCP